MPRTAQAPATATEPVGTPAAPDTSSVAPELTPPATPAEPTNSGPLITFSLEALELLTSNFNAQRIVQGDEVVQMALIQDGDSYTLAVVREAVESVETPAEDTPAEEGD